MGRRTTDEVESDINTISDRIEERNISLEVDIKSKLDAGISQHDFRKRQK